MLKETYSFGNRAYYDAIKLSCADEKVVADEITLEKIQPNYVSFLKAQIDINSSWQVLNDQVSGKQFEVAVINPNTNKDNGDDIEMSDGEPSLSESAGNAVMFAENGALNPNRRRIYVAGFGYGKTSYWDKNERKYIRHTGRYTQKDGSVLPTIKALSRALVSADFNISRISADGIGGAQATALMALLPKGQVTHVYIKGRPNIANHSNRYIWGIGSLLTTMVDRRRYDRISVDEWRSGPDLINLAKLKTQTVYGPDSKCDQAPEASVRANWINRKWLETMSSAVARCSPALVDTSIALCRQPEALITYHFPAEDMLYKNMPEDAFSFLGELCSSRLTRVGQTEALIMPGTHFDHMSYPSIRWSAEKYAFERIKTLI